MELVGILIAAAGVLLEGATFLLLRDWKRIDLEHKARETRAAEGSE